MLSVCTCACVLLSVGKVYVSCCCARLVLAVMSLGVSVHDNNSASLKLKKETQVDGRKPWKTTTRWRKDQTCNGVLVSCQPLMVLKAAVHHSIQPVRLVDVPVGCVLYLFWCIPHKVCRLPLHAVAR